MADRVGQLRFYFPKVVVGDIEPLGFGTDPEELVGWIDTYRSVAGRSYSPVESQCLALRCNSSVPIDPRSRRLKGRGLSADS